MPNIPGITNYVSPGAYSVIISKSAASFLNANPSVIAIIGRGQREEVLVLRAVGNGKDGEPANFQKGNDPDGRHFRLKYWPVIPGTIEIYINPIGDPAIDLPLIQITSSKMAKIWTDTYGDLDMSTNYWGKGQEGYDVDGYYQDSIDGYRNIAQNETFFQSKYAKQFETLKKRLGIPPSIGKYEPNHYVFDPDEGKIILDQPLNSYDTMIVSYIAESDLNTPELMFDIKDVIEKHGYPTKENTISLAAQMAYENGAAVVMPVDGGRTLTGAGSSRRMLKDPYYYEALKALEREELVDIIVPIIESRIYGEVIMPFYEEAVYGDLTGNGAYLQESPLTGDQPGINISPLDVIPQGRPRAGEPTFLKVYKNGRLLEYGLDYSIPNLTDTDPSQFVDTREWGPDHSTNVAIILANDHPDATHLIDNRLEEGDRITADYLPDPATINLVATGQIAVIQHCERMSQVNWRQERTCLLGAYEFCDLNFIIDPITGIMPNYGLFYRSMFFYPGGYKITRVVAGEIQTLDAQYIAAAASGYVVSRALPESLTNKILIGFTIPPDQKLTKEEVAFIGGAGCAIVKPLAAGGKVMHGRTTVSTRNPVEEEYSVIRIRDFVSKEMRKGLQERFLGRLITKSMPNDIKFAAESMLRAMISQGMLTAYDNVSAVVDEIDPRQIDVGFEIKPVFALTWIFIKIVVST